MARDISDYCPGIPLSANAQVWSDHGRKRPDWLLNNASIYLRRTSIPTETGDHEWRVAYILWCLDTMWDTL